MSTALGTTRALSAPEREAFRLGRLVAAQQAPYFMHALFAVSPLVTTGLGTFAVDDAWRLYMDPDLLLGGWDSATVAAVLLHEVGHLIRDHAGRATQLPTPRNHLAWNLAGDAEINDDLIAAGIPLPEGVITPQALGYENGDLAENYYANAQVMADTLPDDGSAGCGSGSGSPRVPGELPAGVALGDASDQGQPVSAADADMVRRRVAIEIQATEQAKGRGTLPAGLTRWASGVLTPPTIPWTRMLSAAVRRAVSDQAGRVDYTYRRPARREVPGIIRPAMRAPSVIVTLIVDTSGSMTQEDLDAAMSEVTGVLKSSGIDRGRLRLLSCDAAASTPQIVRSPAALRLTGGGGTDMRIGITTAENSRPTPHVIIVLTDGDTPWPATPTRANLICAVISHRPPHDTPPWATTVHITPRAA